MSVFCIGYSFSALVLAILDRSSLDIGIYKASLYYNLIAHLEYSAFLAAGWLCIFSFSSRAVLIVSASVAEPLESPQVDWWRALWVFGAVYAGSVLVRVVAYAAGKTHFLSDVGYGDIFGPFGSLAAIFASISLYMPAVFMALYAETFRKVFLYFCLICLCMESIYGIAFGLKSVVILGGFYLLYCFRFYFGRFPSIKVLSIGFLLSVVTIQAAQLSRTVFSTQGSIADIGVGSFFTSLTDDSYKIGQGKKSTASSYYFSRFNVTIPLLASIAYVESKGEPAGGLHYLNAPLALVPSFIFPWKPSSLSVNEYGRRVGLIAPDNFNTAIRAGILGDLYYSVGLLGFFVSAFVLGILLRLTKRVIVQSRCFLSNMALMMVFVALADFENQISNNVGGLIKILFIIWIGGFVAIRRSTKEDGLVTCQKVVPLSRSFRRIR